MHRVPYLVFGLIFFLDYLIGKSYVPNVMGWAPEALSGVLLFFLVIRISGTKNLNLSFKYIVLFSLLLMHITVGIVLNSVSEGPIIVGLRYYLKFFPVFLLPAVLDFSEKQIVTQLKVLLLLALLQLPLTFYQRFIEYSHLFTGDVISGTLGVSSILSIYLICSIFLITAFYLRKRLSGPSALLLAFLVFLPCTINETKGTIVLMPIGLLTIIFVAFRSEFNLAKLLGVLSITSVFFIVFLTIYNSQYSKAGQGGSLLGFFSDGGAEGYLYQDVEFDPDILKRHGNNITLSSEIIETKVRMPRVDRLIAPFAILYTQPLKLYFGLGIGNVSQFKYADWEGEYAYISRLMSVETLMMSLILWELGIGGVLIYFVFFYIIFMDAKKLTTREDSAGALSAAWLGIVALVVVSLAYKNIMQFNVIGYLFFYFSGYIAAERYRTEKLERKNRHDQLNKGSPYFVTAPKMDYSGSSTL